VVAGHIAQEILHVCPLTQHEIEKRGGAPHKRKPHAKNRRKFWSTLIYSRIVAWGKDFYRVTLYVMQNSLEALGIIPYKNITKRFALAAIAANSSNTS